MGRNRVHPHGRWPGRRSSTLNSRHGWSRWHDQIVPTVFWSIVTGVVALAAAFAAFRPPSVVDDFNTQVVERMLFIMGFAALISVATGIGLWFHYGAKRP